MNAKTAAQYLPLVKKTYPHRKCIHGDARHWARVPEYTVWQGVVRRTTNPKCKEWPYYGGRGIKICERWRTYALFLEDMGRKPSPNHSIDRTNNDGNYEPGNCRWVLRRDQQRNTRRSIHLSYKGKTQTVPEWASELGIGAISIRTRLSRGWSVQKALGAPVQTRRISEVP